MGILIGREESPGVYDDIIRDVGIIERNSELQISGAPPAKAPRTQRKTWYCIRCGCRIPLDVGSPYCRSDYASWEKFRDGNYVKRKGFCHVCGKKNRSSMNRPVCKSCFARNNGKF